jgi:dTMP kinase
LLFGYAARSLCGNMNPTSNPNTASEATWVSLGEAKGGLFVSVEGLDYAGKTTLVENLKPRLAHLGRELVVTREPGGPKPKDGEPNTHAHVTRLQLLEQHHLGIVGDMPDEAAMMYFLASRFAHMHTTILPALRRNAIVLCDRFYGSTWAFQLYGRKLLETYGDMVRKLYLCACRMIPRHPDVFVFLTAPEELLQERRRNRPGEQNHVDRMGADFHQNVRRGYERFFALDGQPPESGLDFIVRERFVSTSLGSMPLTSRVIADGTLEREPLADSVAEDIARFL